jgi:hypothetical protein
MAFSGRRVAAFSIFVFMVMLTGCADTSVQAGPELGDKSRPIALAAAVAATGLTDGTDDVLPGDTRTLDICQIQGDVPIGNPSAPLIYSCDIYRVTLLRFTPTVSASTAASSVDEGFAARACTIPAPLVVPSTERALEALDAGSEAPPIRGRYVCSGESVTATFGRADNASMREQAQIMPRPVSGTVVTEQPRIGVGPLDEILESGEVFVAFVQTKVNYVDTQVCGGLSLC